MYGWVEGFFLVIVAAGMFTEGCFFRPLNGVDTMRVALVIGTRPQIKSAPIIDEAGGFPEIDLSIIHMGQHYDYEMSRVFFNELGLPDPAVNLGVGPWPR